MRSFIWALVALAFVPPNTVHAAEEGPSSFSGILVDSNTSYIDDVTFDKLPHDAEAAAAIPADATTNYRVMWNCRVGGDAVPKDCRTIAIWPENADDQRLRRDILPLIKLSAKNVETLRRTRGRVTLDIYLDDPKRRLDTTCPSFWCPSIPRPPSG